MGKGLLKIALVTTLLAVGSDVISSYVGREANRGYLAYSKSSTQEDKTIAHQYWRTSVNAELAHECSQGIAGLAAAGALVLVYSNERKRKTSNLSE